MKQMNLRKAEIYEDLLLNLSSLILWKKILKKLRKPPRNQVKSFQNHAYFLESCSLLFQ